MPRTKKESIDSVEEVVAETTPEKGKNYWKELVEVKFNKIRGVKDQPDVIIGVNNRNWQIKRGVTVKIPRYALQAYIESEDAADAADDYIQGSAIT